MWTIFYWIISEYLLCLLVLFLFCKGKQKTKIFLSGWFCCHYHHNQHHRCCYRHCQHQCYHCWHHGSLLEQISVVKILDHNFKSRLLKHQHPLELVLFCLYNNVAIVVVVLIWFYLTIPYSTFLFPVVKRLKLFSLSNCLLIMSWKVSLLATVL